MEKYLPGAVAAASATVPFGTVTDTNAVDYLAAIEARVTELLDVYASMHAVQHRPSILHRNPARKSVSVPAVKPHSSPQPHGPLVVNKMTQFKLPSVADDDSGDGQKQDENDENLRLMSRGELVGRTVEMIKRNHERFRSKKGNPSRPPM